MPTQDRMADAQRRVTAAYRKQRRNQAITQRADAEAATARAVTSLAMQAAEMSLAAGTTTARSISLVNKLSHAFDLPVHIDITYTRIALSYQPSVASDPITLMRVVPTGLDYDRLTRVEHLVSRIAEQDMPLEEAQRRLDQIANEPRVYRFWVMLMGAGVLGAAVAALLGGAFADMVAATIATILCEMARVKVAERGLNAFFAQATGAAMPALLGLAVMTLRPHLPWLVGDVRPSLVVAAGMVSLLAGIGVVTAAGDMLDGHYISSAARIMEVISLTGGIVLGLLVTLWVGLRLGVPAAIAPAEGLYSSPMVQIVSAGAITLGYGILCNMGPRSLVAATSLGTILWIVYLAIRGAVTSSASRAAIAAMAIGFLARLGNRPLRLPVVAMVTTGVAPLMPGLLLYRGVYAMTSGTPLGGRSASDLLLLCALTGLALAAGSSLGTTMCAVVLRVVRSIRRSRQTASAPDEAAVEVPRSRTTAPPAPAQER